MGIQKAHASGPFVLKEFYELELHPQLGKYFDLEHLLFLLELCDPPLGPSLHPLLPRISQLGQQFLDSRGTYMGHHPLTLGILHLHK